MASSILLSILCVYSLQRIAAVGLAQPSKDGREQGRSVPHQALFAVRSSLMSLEAFHSEVVLEIRPCTRPELVSTPAIFLMVLRR